jgi:hypothetical protein
LSHSASLGCISVCVAHSLVKNEVIHSGQSLCLLSQVVLASECKVEIPV